MPVPVTSLYAALLGLLILFLAYRIVRIRKTRKIGLGTGGDKELEHAMRVHSNAVEYIPIALLLIGLLEINDTPRWAIHALGGSLLLARVWHLQGFGSSAGVSTGRFVGTALTWAVILLASLANIVHYALWAF